jgi:hypothetical protein
MQDAPDSQLAHDASGDEYEREYNQLLMRC